MIDTSFIDKNKIYEFDEKTHTYYYNGNKVDISVTSFIEKYYSKFDTENISAMYARKHNMLQEDVKKMWKDIGHVTSISGTIIHSILESCKNNLPVNEDYSYAESLGLKDRVIEEVNILRPKAYKFIEDTKDLITPIATEYTVGLEDKLAGNIDLLAYNNEEKEIQIWDYKNTKEIKQRGRNKCFTPFIEYPDCNYIHYCMQLSFYKAMAQRLLGINIGKMYIVHFNYKIQDDNYTIYDVLDFTDICNKELDKLLNKNNKILNNNFNQGILGNVPF